MATTHNDAPEACRNCGESLAPGQEWCLTCGSAAPRRMRRHSGGRAVLATVGITLALTSGAVAASYAALSKDPVKKGDIALPYTTPPPAPAVTAPAPEPVKTAAKTPKKNSERKAEKAAAAAAAAEQKAAAEAAAAAKAKADQKTTTEATAASVKPEALTISESSGALYDPLSRAQFTTDEPNEPAAVLDDDLETSWAVTAGGADNLQVGYVIDLKKDTSVNYIELVTDTPGFRAEIYGASADELPPQITDSRWADLKARDNVDGTKKEKGKIGDGKEKITLPDDGQKYRYLLIWATTPAAVTPPDPPSRTVRLFDVKVYGTPSK